MGHKQHYAGSQLFLNNVFYYSMLCRLIQRANIARRACQNVNNFVVFKDYSVLIGS